MGDSRRRAGIVLFVMNGIDTHPITNENGRVPLSREERAEAGSRGNDLSGGSVKRKICTADVWAVGFNLVNENGADDVAIGMAGLMDSLPAVGTPEPATMLLKTGHLALQCITVALSVLCGLCGLRPDVRVARWTMR